jgi:hypothetical protein
MHVLSSTGANLQKGREEWVLPQVKCHFPFVSGDWGAWGQELRPQFSAPQSNYDLKNKDKQTGQWYVAFCHEIKHNTSVQLCGSLESWYSSNWSNNFAWGMKRSNHEQFLISNFRLFWMLYAFFWVVPRRLNFIFRRFGTPCLFHLHRQVGK